MSSSLAQTYQPTLQNIGKYKDVKGNPPPKISHTDWDSIYNTANSLIYDPAKKIENRLVKEGKSEKELVDLGVRAMDICKVARKSGATRILAVALLIKDKKLAEDFKDHNV